MEEATEVYEIKDFGNRIVISYFDLFEEFGRSIPKYEIAFDKTGEEISKEGNVIRREPEEWVFDSTIRQARAEVLKHLQKEKIKA